MTRKPYEAPAIVGETKNLGELLAMHTSDAPFVLCYLRKEPDGSYRLVTLSNATEPQRLLVNALAELERRQPPGPLQ